MLTSAPVRWPQAASRASSAGMAVVSFDGSSESTFSWPPLTTMRQPVREMAHAAVELLARRDAASHVHYTFDAQLIVRQSCGCPLTLEHI